MAKRILMIDDALPLHRIVEAHFAGLALEVVSALDGTTGLAAAARLGPTLILLDLDLPDLGGFEVCRQLKADPRTAAIPVIFCTAEGGVVDRERGRSLGAVDYVAKPFNLDQLAGRVLAAIRHQNDAERAAGIDAVTGLWTRAHVDQHAAGAMPVPGRAGEPASYLVADVDGMRLINARHGMLAGDRVLRYVAGVFQRRCDAVRALCWAGDGRFGALLPGSDRRAAGRIAALVGADLGRGLPSPEGETTGVSCSFGIADTRAAGNATLVSRAEAALARAKSNGAARVCIARAGRRIAA